MLSLVIYLLSILFYNIGWCYYRNYNIRIIFKPIPALLLLICKNTPYSYISFFLLGDISLLFDDTIAQIIGIICFSLGHLLSGVFSYYILLIIKIYIIYRIIYPQRTINYIDALIYLFLLLIRVNEQRNIPYFLFLCSDILLITNEILNNCYIEMCMINLYWLSIYLLN